jgi:TolB protein
LFSPPTNTLAFVSSQDSNQEIYLLDVPRRIQHNLTRHIAQDDWPTWSPDGRYLAFWSNRDARAGIYVMDVYSGAVQPLPIAAGASATGLKWSPDGEYLAFSSPYGGGNDIYIAELNCDGLSCDSIAQRIVSFDADDTSPEWSPDSRELAFVSNWKWRGTLQVYVVNRNGTHVRALTRARTYSFQPSWSPDGATIAFVSNRENVRGWQIYLMRADCASILRQNCIPQVITANYMVSRGLDWSPDGRLIAFSSDSSNEHNLYVVDIGSCLSTDIIQGAIPGPCISYPLTDQRGFNLHPAWQP